MKYLKDSTILLAEDNEADVSLMRRILKRFGIAEVLRVVNNGQEAIKYLTGEPPYDQRQTHPFPSLLILDLDMPQTSGIEVLDWIRTKPTMEKLFVVVFTQGSHVREVTKMFEQHANTCIFNSHFMKPATETNVEMLLQLFESWQKAQKK